MLNTPTLDDFIDFTELAYDVLTPRGLLDDLEREGKRYDELLAHEVAKWYLGNNDFIESVNKLYGEQVNIKELKGKKTILIVANICSRVFNYMLSSIAVNVSVKVTNQSTKNKALNHVNALLGLIMNESLQMESLNEYWSLVGNLRKMRDELKGLAPTSYPTSNKGSLLDNKVVRMLYEELAARFDNVTPAIIDKFVNMIGCDIGSRQIQRIIESHKVYLDEMKAYEARQKSRKGIASLLAGRLRDT